MTRPRIVSSTPPPKRLFPPLPADVAQLLVGDEPTRAEPVERPRVAPPARTPPRRWQRVLHARRAAAELLLVFWTLYVTLVLSGVPLPAW